MKVWLALAIRLYPSTWRARYGDEVRALLEDARPAWCDVADLFRGALTMQITHGTAFLKLLAGLAIAGALIAAAVAVILPQRYVSSATFTPPPEGIDPLQEVLSRGRLSAAIQAYDLYPEERRRLPLEDVVQQMRSRDIQVHPSPAYRISFTYPDRQKAQQVTARLAADFHEQCVRAQGYRLALWRQFFTELHRPVPESPPAPLASLLQPATLPERVGPNRVAFAAWGILLGVLAAVTVRWPGRTLRAALCAFAGCLAAFECSYLIPASYVSTANLRFGPPLIPAQMTGAAPTDPTQRFQELRGELLSDETMARLLANTVLHLDYRGDFPSRVRQLRADIQIEPGSAANAFHISFSDSDPHRAQHVVQDLTANAVERWFLERKAITGNAILQAVAEHQVGGNLMVFDPPTLPDSPETPDRVTFAAVGLAMGLLAGLVTPAFRPVQPCQPQASGVS